MRKPKNKRIFVDLFCGAGGLTWGWARAGFTPVGAVDNDPTALATYERNLGNLEHRILNVDLARKPAASLAQQLGLTPGRVTAVIGGPPCQGWSRVGRGKLRSLGRASEDMLKDPRNRLYRRFVEFVAHVRPRVCVMENVPGMLSVRGQNVADVVQENFEDIGYRCTYHLADAHWFGVPQVRHRVIFIATPARRPMIDAAGLEPFAERFCRGIAHLPGRVTVASAFRDLPRIPNGATENPIPYGPPPGRPSAYSRLMRMGSNGELHDHICRRQNEQDLEAFRTMKQGMKYYQLAPRFKRYRDDIFPDKYKRLIWNEPSWTVTAHLAKDCYTHIHAREARTISIREAARLQSFPDNFRFVGNMGDRFRQIGNAVPPLMAWAIAEFVKKELRS